jgi:hypothetical protein
VGKIYLYMTRRDKQGVRVVSILEGKDVGAIRLSDITLESLNLNHDWYRDIKQILHDNRMMWEGWIESAPSWEVLKNNLRKRGFTSVPNHSNPAYTKSVYSTPAQADTKWIPDKKTMVQPTQDARNNVAHRILNRNRPR